MLNFNPKLLETVKKLPNSPGVYIYKNIDKEIIYVGKAISLKKRVSQYFQREDALGPKTSALVSQIEKIEHRVVESELQALLLEASLIKQFKPKFNSQLRDDKSYIYLCITNEPVPRIFSTHKTKLNDKDDFYGPFPDGGSVRRLLKIIRRIYPYRSCRVLPKKPCLYYDLGLCTAPCVNPVGYNQIVGKIRKFLNGNITSLIVQTKKQIVLHTKAEEYEKALEQKKQLDSLLYITTSWQSAQDLHRDHNLQDDQTSRALDQLHTTLIPYFENLPKLKRIECFDISNFGNNYFVGAMTVFDNYKVDNSEYRKFKIKTKANQDDMYMMKEVVWRRLQHPEWGSPDLIVLDGGKPQLSVVLPIFKNHENILVVGLAKKLETIVIKVGEEWHEINLPKNSSGLQLLQRLRDEAHRFGNKYRKELMQRDAFPIS